MFEFYVAVCLMTNMNSEPVNPCRIEQSPQVYRTRESCKRSLDILSINIYKEFLDDESIIPVIDGFCSPVKGNRS